MSSKLIGQPEVSINGEKLQVHGIEFTDDVSKSSGPLNVDCTQRRPMPVGERPATLKDIAEYKASWAPPGGWEPEPHIAADCMQIVGSKGAEDFLAEFKDRLQNNCTDFLDERFPLRDYQHAAIDEVKEKGAQFQISVKTSDKAFVPRAQMHMLYPPALYPNLNLNAETEEVIDFNTKFTKEWKKMSQKKQIANLKKMVEADAAEKVRLNVRNVQLMNEHTDLSKRLTEAHKYGEEKRLSANKLKQIIERLKRLLELQQNAYLISEI